MSEARATYRAADPRDRIIGVAVDFARYREKRRELSRLIRSRPCKSPRPGALGPTACYHDKRWAESFHAPDDYCDACRLNLEAAIERHALREAERSALTRLECAARALKTAQDQSRFIPFVIARC